MDGPRSWIGGDESAAAMLARVPAASPVLLPPPLHRAPLRAGDVVEITGPSPSAKSELLLQAVVSCILPKEWNGVHFGGMESAVLYFDLDCRFDVVRLSRVLKQRIMAHQSTHLSYWETKEVIHKNNVPASQISVDTDELFLACMRRFLYVRCYSSGEFLAAIKTCDCAQMECEALGGGIQFLVIDSIGAFYWMDRACQPVLLGEDKRKTLSLQNVVETTVKEIRNLLQVQPAVVLATKATLFGSGISTNGARRTFGKRSADDMTALRLPNEEGEKFLYHEYMPSVWQSFVTHRIHLRVSDGFTAEKPCGTFPVYTSEWIQPVINTLDKFTYQLASRRKGEGGLPSGRMVQAAKRNEKEIKARYQGKSEDIRA